MTKKQEIEALQNFIESLPRDSYLRPWLNDILPQVQSEIQSDFMLSPSLTATRAACTELADEAKRNCAKVLVGAETEAAGILKSARAAADLIRGRMFDEIRHCQRILES